MASKKNGFTIIEIIVVVSVIGALITIAMPSMTEVRRKSVEQTCFATTVTLDKVYAVAMLQDSHLTQIGWSVSHVNPDDPPMFWTPTSPLWNAFVDEGYLRRFPVCTADGVYKLVSHTPDTSYFQVLCTYHPHNSGIAFDPDTGWPYIQ